jgi:hypothetical protein
MMIPTTVLLAFVRESNLIERIEREPLESELEAHLRLLSAPRPSVAVLEQFVASIAPGHVLRDKPGLNVQVGSHVPLPGGPRVRYELQFLLEELETSRPQPIYCRYEKLHPFTDGNGRSGRALWLWLLLRQRRTLHQQSFLHTFHYQTLEEHDRRG